MRVSSVEPAAVFPDTEPGRGFAMLFYPNNARLTEHRVIFCAQYQRGHDGMTCSLKSPAPDYVAPKGLDGRRFGCEFNWCTRCAAGYMQQLALGMDTTHHERIRG